jgi:hypothetical protein
MQPFNIKTASDALIIERALAICAGFDECTGRAQRATKLADDIRNHIAQPEPSRLYLELYHGATDPLELDHDDEGKEGPLFGPYDRVQLVPTGLILQRDADGTEHALDYTQDVQFYYDGLHYGCTEVKINPVPEELTRLQSFDAERAKVPPQHDPRAGLDGVKKPQGSL